MIIITKWAKFIWVKEIILFKLINIKTLNNSKGDRKACLERFVRKLIDLLVFLEWDIIIIILFLNILKIYFALFCIIYIEHNLLSLNYYFSQFLKWIYTHYTQLMKYSLL